MAADALTGSSRYRVWLGLILLAALALRGGWGWTRGVGDAALDALPDQREYLTLARSLLKGEGLKFLDARFAEVVYAYRTPGYPLFLAACGANPRVARLAQAVLDTGTVWAVCLMARMLVTSGRSRGIALGAAALVAFNPFLIYFAGLILSETLFTALLAWGMFLLLRENPRIGDSSHSSGPRLAAIGTMLWLLGGALLAFSALVRPSAALLPVVMGVAAVFVNREPRPRPRGRENRGEQPAYQRYPRHWPLPVGTTMLLWVLLMLLPWALRNQRALGEWVWTSTNGGITLYDGFNPDAIGNSDQSFVKTMPELRQMNEVDRDRYLGDLARKFIRQHPGRAVWLAVEKFARTWSPMPLSAEYRDWRYRAVALAYSLPFDLLVVIGLWRGGAAGLSRSAQVFLLLPAIYFTGVHTLTVGSLRYRVPVEPPMAVIAAAGGAYAIARLTDDPWRRVRGPVGH